MLARPSCLRHLGQEGSCFLRPPFADHHQPARPNVRVREVRAQDTCGSSVGALRPFAAPGCGDPSQCTQHEGGVQGQLPPPKQGEPVRDHFQTSHVKRIGTGDPCRAPGVRCSPLQTRAFPEPQTWRKLHGGATRVVTLGQRERETQATKEQNTKEGWFNRLVTSPSLFHC